MKRLLVFLAAAVGLLSLIFTGAASAHVVVQPNTVGVAEFQIFTVNVPTEKAVPTTAVRLLIPAGMDEVTPTVKTGWNISTKKTGDNVTEIDWTGGSLPAGFRDDFTFSAEAPPQPTTLKWKAYQTYADGSVVSWDATPNGSDDASGNQGPYSTTKVIDDLTKPSTSAHSDSVALIVATIALVISLLAFIKSWTAKNS